MNILGLNAYHGDVSAALVRDGQLIAAVEEERYRRIKHVAGFPRPRCRACLEMGGIDAVRRRRVRGLARPAGAPSAQSVVPPPAPAEGHRGVARAQHGQPPRAAVHSRGGARRSTRRACAPRMQYVEHHPAHLASAAFVSPFDEAAVCAIDGFGDFVSTSWGRVAGSRIDDRRPRLLSAFARTAVSGDHPVPRVSQLRRRVQGDGPRPVRRAAVCPRDRISRAPARRWRFRARPLVLPALVRRRADDVGGRRAKAGRRCSRPSSSRCSARRVHGDEPVAAKHEAIAASLQVVYERAAMHVLRHVQKATGSTKLCLAGGCAMNSVANGKIREQTAFRDVFIQPAAGDNGTALGAAFYAWNQIAGRPRGFVMEHGYWGPSFDDDAIVAALDAEQAAIAGRGCARRAWTGRGGARRLDRGADCRRPRRRLVSGADGVGRPGARQPQHRRRSAPRRHARDHQHADQVPRALPPVCAIGARRKRSTTSSSAPSPDPFMLQVYPVRPDKRAVVPAITHVDGSGRLQTVSARIEPALLQPDQGVRPPDRRADAAEHVVQRKRADRADAGAGARLFPENEHGRARDRPPRARACASAGGADRRGRSRGWRPDHDGPGIEARGRSPAAADSSAGTWRPRCGAAVPRCWCRARRSTTSRARPTSSGCTPTSRPIS